MKKIFAYAILLITYFFPFRYAYFTPPDTGKISLMNFLLVVAGFVLFTLLLFKAETKQE